MDTVSGNSSDSVSTEVIPGDAYVVYDDSQVVQSLSELIDTTHIVGERLLELIDNIRYSNERLDIIVEYMISVDDQEPGLEDDSQEVTADSYNDDILTSIEDISKALNDNLNDIHSIYDTVSGNSVILEGYNDTFTEYQAVNEVHNDAMETLLTYHLTTGVVTVVLIALLVGGGVAKAVWGRFR